MIPTPCRIGYLRVSTPEQRFDRQALGLQALCDEIHVETASAVAAARPVFDSILARLRPGDTLLIWDLDRAFRSTLDALNTARALQERGVHLRLVQQNIDTATPEGEFFYTMIAAVAQLERNMLSRRTREGMAAARKRGVRIGRPRCLSDKTMRQVRKAVIHQGLSYPEAARKFGISESTARRAVRHAEDRPNQMPHPQQAEAA